MKQFHITIGAGTSKDVLLENDLKLVKAALLYADHAKLFSCAYDVIVSVLKTGNFTPEERWEYIEPFLSEGLTDEKECRDFQSLQEILKKKFPTIEERQLQEKIQSDFETIWNAEIKNKVPFLSQDFELKELSEAVKSGLLEIQQYEALKDESKVLTDDELKLSIERVTDESIGLIMEAVASGTTYPLFDEGISQIVRQCIQEGKILVSPTHVARGKQSKLGASLLERLPLFESATVNEILDIRKELERHLIRFRSAVIKYSEKVRTASWDRDFPLEAEEVFQREVEPAVLDLEDAVKTNSSLITLLARKSIDKPLSLVGGSAIGLFLASQDITHPLISLAIGGAVAASTAIFDAKKDWQKQRLSVEQNQLFFYYRAKQRLLEKN